MATKSATFRDPRLRGKYMDFLSKRQGAPRNTPGLDYNRSGQALNSVRGSNTASVYARPRKDEGRMMQDNYRNRANEQAGLATPAQPSTVPYTPAPRRG